MGLLTKLPKSEHLNWPWNLEVSEELYKLCNIKWPKISIVTPSFNQGSFIEETIRSILLQNYPNIEYIVMDGGSTDETLQILDSYKPWINTIVSEKDKGQSDALIKGFNQASGHILNWINSDDILCENALFYIGKTFAENPELSIVHGNNGIMDVNSVLINFMPHPNDNLKIRYLCEMPYGQQACFFTKSIYEKSGGINQSINFSMDYEMYLRMHLLDINVMRIDELIGNIRIHDNTKTAQLEAIMYQENGNALLTFLNSVNQKRYSNWMKKIGFFPYKNYEVKLQITHLMVKKVMQRYFEKNVWYYYNNKQYKISNLMIFMLFTLSFKSIFNLNYLKIIKDGAKFIKFR